MSFRSPALLMDFWTAKYPNGVLIQNTFGALAAEVATLARMDYPSKYRRPVSVLS